MFALSTRHAPKLKLFQIFQSFYGLAWKYELALMHDIFRYLLVHVLYTDLHVPLYTVVYILYIQPEYAYSMLLLYASWGCA